MIYNPYICVIQKTKFWKIVEKQQQYINVVGWIKIKNIVTQSTKLPNHNNYKHIGEQNNCKIQNFDQSILYQ